MRTSITSIAARVFVGGLSLLATCCAGSSGGGTASVDVASTGGMLAGGGVLGFGGMPSGARTAGASGYSGGAGASASAGSTRDDGLRGSGGLTELGGRQGFGGTVSLGGTSASGAPGVGGATTVGGGTATGGTTRTGGTSGRGGSAGAGGTSAAGGTRASGGTRALGGAQLGTTPPITPRWAFEPWAWEDNTNTRQSTESLIAGYLSREIPVGAVIIDSPWETRYNTLVWDTARYSSPQAMIAGFHAKGVKVVMWLTAFVNTDSPDYQTVKTQKYGVNNGTNATWWKGTGIHIDITNPAAATWWNSLLSKALADGIDGWKLDRGADYIGDPIKTLAGSISATDFKKRLSADFFDTTIAANPNAIVMVRPFNAAQGGVGSEVSKCSMGWVGDHDGRFAGIATQLRDIYTSAQMGYGAVGVEVGGYYSNPPSKNSLIRYAQFGALTPLMENGGENGGQSQHLPWYWDATTVSNYRYFATLHSELGAYNFSYGVDAHLTGTSILRGTDKARAQHLLGDQLLVSVITTDVTSKSVSFPSGSNWIDYWNEDAVYAGGTSTQYNAPLTEYPIFIKTGAIIPMDVKTAVTGHGDATSAGKITVLIYPRGKSSFTFHRPLGEGTAYSDVEITMDTTSGTVRVTGAAAASYRLRVKSMQVPTGVTGADAWSYDDAKKVVVIDKQGSTFSLVVGGLQGYP